MRKTINTEIAYSISSIAISVLLLFLFSRSCLGGAVPANAVELRVGLNFSGGTNIVLTNGLNVPAGSLCEIRNASDLMLLDKFYIGAGTESPPGAFKDGQFDYLFTIGPNPTQSSTLNVILRVYNAATTTNATSFGDSPIIQITGGNEYNLPGWILSKNVSSNNDHQTSPNNGNSNNTTQNNNSNSRIGLIIICSSAITFAIVMSFYIFRRKKNNRGSNNKKISRKNKRKK